MFYKKPQEDGIESVFNKGSLSLQAQVRNYEKTRESFSSCYCILSPYTLSACQMILLICCRLATTLYMIYIVRKDLKLSQFAYLCTRTCYFERISTFTLRRYLDAVLETVKVFRVQSCTLSMVPSCLRKGRGGTTNLVLFSMFSTGVCHIA